VWQKHWNHRVQSVVKTDMFGEYVADIFDTSSEMIQWDNIPDDIEAQLRSRSKIVQSQATRIATPAKHKYAMVLGRDNRETKHLRHLFESRNAIFPYPKQRGQ